MSTLNNNSVKRELIMGRNKIYETMINEYREACRDYYETAFGEKLNIKYTIKNEHTFEIINGTKSGQREDKVARGNMMVIRRMMIAIFGDNINEVLEQIRKEERQKEKKFFKDNPKYICYVTGDVQ